MLAGGGARWRRRDPRGATVCGAAEHGGRPPAQIMNIRTDPEELLRRLMLVARGLGFVVLVYVAPVVLRDVLGRALPGDGLVGVLRADPAGPWIPLAVVLATLALSTLLVRLYARAGEGAEEPVPLLTAGSGAAAEWARGLAIGAAFATLAVLPLHLAGELSIVGPGAAGRAPLATLAVAVVLLAEAAREEMGFRGPSLRDLAHATRFAPAAVFLAASFALAHRANPAVTHPALLGIFVAGVALAGVVRARGDLSRACGIHAGWNVALGVLWSVPVSGHRLAGAVLDVRSTGSPWTGGSFGPEAGPTGILAFALLGLWAWTRPPATR